MSLSALQSSWSPALNSGGGGGGGGSSITNGTAPDVGTVSITADGVVAVTSTNAATAGAGSVFLETSLQNHVVISPTSGNTDSIAGPALFAAGAFSGASAYGVGAIVVNGLLGDYYVATAPNPVGAPAPGADGASWDLLASPSTISHTDIVNGDSIVTTLLGDVVATASRNVDILATGDTTVTGSQLALTASGGGMGINATTGLINMSANENITITSTTGNVTLTASAGDADVFATLGDLNLDANAGSVVVGSGDQITLTAGTGGIGLDSGAGGMTISVPDADNNTMIISTGPVPTAAVPGTILLSAGNTDVTIYRTALGAPPGPGTGLVITPTQLYFNGGVVSVAPP